MFAHGEAPFIAKVKTVGHLVGCKNCRAQIREYKSLSLGLANTLKNPTLGAKKIRRWSRVEILGGIAFFLLLIGSVIAFQPSDVPKVEVCEPTSVKAASQPSKAPVKTDQKIFPGPNFLIKSCD